MIAGVASHGARLYAPFTMVGRLSFVHALASVGSLVAGAALLVHCTAFGTSDAGGTSLSEAGVDAGSGEAGSPPADASSGTPFCAGASAGGALVCEDFEGNSVLADPRYVITGPGTVQLEGPGFASGHGLVASAMKGQLANLAATSKLAANVRHMTLSATVKLDAVPMGEIDFMTVDIGGRTLELFVSSDLLVGFASCATGGTCVDTTKGALKLEVGAYTRIELSVDLTGAKPAVLASVGGAAAFPGPLSLSDAVSAPAFHTQFGVMYTDGPATVHLDDLLVRAD